MNPIESNTGPNWPGYNRIWKKVAIALALLCLLLWLLGFGPGSDRCGRYMAAAGTDCETPVASNDARRTYNTLPAYSVDKSVVAARLYFDLDSYALPADSAAQVSKIVQTMESRGDAVAVVSGFHDPSGDLEHNKELSKNRAQAVKDLLAKLGVSEGRILLEKPMQTSGSGDPAEARRVEVEIATLD